MKDTLLFDDPQKDEFIEIFKTPPIPPIEFKKIRRRQANVYILANTSPRTDCFIYAGMPPSTAKARSGGPSGRARVI